MMDMELTQFLSRERYERRRGQVNDRNVRLKGSREVQVADDEGSEGSIYDPGNPTK